MLKKAAITGFMLAVLPLLFLYDVGSTLRRLLVRTRAVPAGPRLQVVYPYPPGEKSGGSKAIQGLLATLERGFALTHVALNEQPARLPWWRARLADRLTWALPMPDHARPFLLAPAQVTGQLRDDQPLVLEFVSGSLFLVFGRRPRAQILLRDHEVLCRRLDMERRNAHGFQRVLAAVRQAYAYLLTYNIYLKVDRIVALTPEDGDYLVRAFPWFRGKTRVISAPIVAPAGSPPGTRTPRAGHALFLANFYHRPNVDGLLWFLEQCAPHLERPLTLHLCGLDKPIESIRLEAPNVTIVRHGFVEDLDAAFGDVVTAIAPLISGGGVRIKNLLLASLGKAILTTSLGNQGIGFEPDRDAVVSDDPRAWARALDRLAIVPEEAVSLALSARARVLSRFGPEEVLAQLRTELFAPDPLDARHRSAAGVAAGV